MVRFDRLLYWIRKGYIEEVKNQFFGFVFSSKSSKMESNLVRSAWLSADQANGKCLATFGKFLHPKFRKSGISHLFAVLIKSATRAKFTFVAGNKPSDTISALIKILN